MYVTIAWSITFAFYRATSGWADRGRCGRAIRLTCQAAFLDCGTFDEIVLSAFSMQCTQGATRIQGISRPKQPKSKHRISLGNARAAGLAPGSCALNILQAIAVSMPPGRGPTWQQLQTTRTKVQQAAECPVKASNRFPTFLQVREQLGLRCTYAFRGSCCKTKAGVSGESDFAGHTTAWQVLAGHHAWAHMHGVSGLQRLQMFNHRQRCGYLGVY